MCGPGLSHLLAVLRFKLLVLGEFLRPVLWMPAELPHANPAADPAADTTARDPAADAAADTTARDPAADPATDVCVQSQCQRCCRQLLP